MHKILLFFSCLTQHRQVAVPARGRTRASPQREDKGTAGPCGPNPAASQAGLRHAAGGELQIGLLRATVPGIKLSPGSSLNDHTGSYTTVLAGGGGSVATAVGGVRDGPDTDTPASRRDDTPLQGTATSTTAAREAGGDVVMRVMLPQLIDTATFNLAFLMVTEAAAAPQRHLLFTRKCQNKPSTVLQG
ncbi:uncharacterized protein BDCG_16174 [Blastomyces dermatitidis ER-3]|uniref:Uncharacterized protein n=1 Tax=Ajellomyces dermatitidis (strain ER-3 / ATCC MYA-2586) TaxID=559297 RepID=A0ABX2VRS2_AJEDR|nr:uncharacterized protein BDCG_16174 [Blastomyces dermatitidis ER-3]OAS99505.1 hypothetical protein BDCG_16174 [Blastomyces dermatitidis ER-3]